MVSPVSIRVYFKVVEDQVPLFQASIIYIYTLLGTNISHPKDLLKMIFLFPTWDMLVPWRVYHPNRKFLGDVRTQTHLDDGCHSGDSGAGRGPKAAIFWGVPAITHRIHVWYIYLHLVDFYGKCS